MIIVKIIIIILAIKGLWSLFFPSNVQKTVNIYSKLIESHRMLFGVLPGLIGGLFIYISRRGLFNFLNHWIIVIIGIYMIFVGISVIVFPKIISRCMVWYVKDKRFISLMGFILFITGIVLFHFLP